ncbi:DUF202 domain-containing protein [Limibacter armeniacum]|uniref:DUF202 domain-containing protein n=1 Tax=Limibacter armeniacum TaxID=466084 RepID=UPI002FE6C000
MMENKELITRDYLAIERTKLANERTFLAYFRTFIAMFSSGLAILELDFLAQVDRLGVGLLVLSPCVLLVGILQLIRVRKVIRKYYHN